MKFWLLLLLAGLANAAELPRIAWDASTQRLLQPGATYGRMRRLADGAVLCCYENAGRTWTMRSEDNAKTWLPPVEAGSFAHGAAANPELCVLRSGTVLCFFNERPKVEGGDHSFTLRLSASTDGGRSWTRREAPVYVAGNSSRTACWEPAAVEMPDGEVRLFFAHELPGQQEIAMMTSRDAGATWTAARQVSLRPARRDGMPVPCLLQDGRLVFSIEDNGIAGRDRPHPPFRPSIIDYERADRWMALKVAPPDKNNLSAPYLVRLPSGETLLSAQSNAEDPRWHRMAVFVGDEQAKNFTHRSLPFGLPPEADGFWNSLFIKDASTVIALSNTSIGGQRGLWCVEGRVRRGAEPFVGSVPSGGPVPVMNVQAQGKHPLPDRDRFGGFLDVKLEATGNFRVQQENGRWVFVTPDGHPYIALGPNHTGPTIRDQGRRTGLWARWNHSPDETAAGMLGIIHGLGFTAGDVYQPESTYTRTLPWITFFWYGPANHTFVDVFDVATMADVTRRAFAHAESVADNPWVLGIGGPDLSIWDWKLVRRYRELPPESAGRKRYAAFVRERYAGDIAKFNDVYGTHFQSFDELTTPAKLTLPADLEDDKLDAWTLRWKLTVPPEKSTNPPMQADNDAFCALVAETLFPQVRAAVKRGAPHHLFLGEHLAVRMIPDAVIEVMGKYVDGYLAQAVEVSPQRPPEWQVFQADRWDAEYKLLRKPVIIVDWGAVFSFGEPFEYRGATIKPEREASDEAAKFITDAFGRPYIIGLFLCKLLGDHKNDENFFQNRATRSYLKHDATPYPYRTEALKQALFTAQQNVLRTIRSPK